MYTKYILTRNIYYYFKERKNKIMQNRLVLL